MALDYEEIGRNIRHCRKSHNLKQQQLAELVDTSSGHISHIECGKAKMSTELLIQISQVLSVNLYELLGSNVESPPAEVASIEINTALLKATQSQRKMCVKIIRAILEHEK